MSMAELCEDILALVVQKITNLSDYIRFIGVCSLWRSVALKDRRRRRQQLPGLIIPAIPTCHDRRFLPATRIQDHDGSRRQLPPLAVPHGSLCYGSHQGWLVILDTHNYISMHVINPVTGVQFSLPNTTSISTQTLTLSGNFSITKAVLSSNPTHPHDPQCMVLLLYHQGGQPSLTFCRLGDTSWTCLDHVTQLDNSYPLEDAIYYNGKFYVLNSIGRVLVCDFNPCFRITELTRPHIRRLEKRYLVESGGELMQVLRLKGGDDGFGSGFEVYRLDVDGNEWVGVVSLGEFALFLGLSQSLSLSELDVPGIRGNHIYFVEDFFERFLDLGYDLGVFSLKNVAQTCNPVRLVLSHEPVWVTPMPW